MRVGTVPFCSRANLGSANRPKADLLKMLPDILGMQGPFAMTSDDAVSRTPLVIPSLRTRIARYREQAAHFARLAEGEPVATIRDQWKDLARNYAYLASTLESDLSRRMQWPSAS